jgi:predicted nucleic acid-binding protein
VTLVVVDASAVVAALTDGGAPGGAVATALAGQHLAAPELLAFEVANVLRRLELSGRLAADSAVLAHADLLDLAVQLWPYAAVAERAFRLRASLTVYNAAYVALAVQLDAPLVTLDQRLAKAALPSCRVLVPGTG